MIFIYARSYLIFKNLIVKEQYMYIMVKIEQYRIFFIFWDLFQNIPECHNYNSCGFSKYTYSSQDCGNWYIIDSNTNYCSKTANLFSFPTFFSSQHQLFPKTILFIKIFQTTTLPNLFNILPHNTI